MNKFTGTATEIKKCINKHLQCPNCDALHDLDFVESIKSTIHQMVYCNQCFSWFKRKQKWQYTLTWELVKETP